MSELESTVRASLELRPDVAQDRIVKAVEEQIVKADPSVRIDRTGYFNHTYIPDLIVTWLEPTGRQVRPYYLRLQLNERQTSEDVDRLGRDSPGIVGLLPGEVELDEGGAGALEENPTTLVAEGSALEDLASVSTDDGFAAMITPAVVRAGRGYLTDEGAADLSHAGAEGFDAAASGDVETTRSAITTLRRHLSDVQAVELERTLGVVWLGSGAPRDDFPTATDLDSAPRPGTLRSTLAVLFARDEISQEGFWERIAEWIGEDDLLSFVNLPASANLQQLMRHASSRLRFVSVAATSSPAAPKPSWAVSEGGLLLNNGDESLHFVTDGRAHSNWPEEHDPPLWEDLKPRVAGYEVERAKFDTGAVSVRVDAKRGSSASEQEAVRASIQDMSGLGRVREVVIRTEERRSVRCRMAAQVATVDRSRKVTAAELGWIALTVVLGSNPDDDVNAALFGASPNADGTATDASAPKNS